MRSSHCEPHHHKLQDQQQPKHKDTRVLKHCLEAGEDDEDAAEEVQGQERQDEELGQGPGAGCAGATHFYAGFDL